MTRTNVRLRTFWHVQCRIWWFNFLYWQPRFRKETLATLILFVFLLGIAGGMVWRARQVEPRYQREIAYLQKKNTELVKALWHMEALKAEAKAKRRGQR